MLKPKKIESFNIKETLIILSNHEDKKENCTVLLRSGKEISGMIDRVAVIGHDTLVYIKKESLITLVGLTEISAIQFEA